MNSYLLAESDEVRLRISDVWPPEPSTIKVETLEEESGEGGGKSFERT